MTAALLANFAILFAAMLALWLIAVRIGDVSFIDGVWGLGMAALALICWLRLGDPGARASLIAAMTVIWGARLGLHLLVRWRQGGEDSRYERILRSARRKGKFASAAFAKVFGPQAVLLFVACLPAQMGILASGRDPIGGLAVAGAALWLVGFLFETIGDAQLARFRADPANNGKVLDTGLWRYTRHPNYFGDVCVWWGIWIAAAEAGGWVAAASVIGPLFVTFTLTRWSGKPLLEAGMGKTRPGYADYAARTSGFIPWPPKPR